MISDEIRQKIIQYEGNNDAVTLNTMTRISVGTLRRWLEELDCNNLEIGIGDKVEILELERNGRIVSVWLTQHGVKYEVRYFDNAEIKVAYFYEDELKIKDINQ